VARESDNAVRALIPPPGTDGNHFRSTREPQASHLYCDRGGRGGGDAGSDRVHRQPGRKYCRQHRQQPGPRSLRRKP